MREKKNGLNYHPGIEPGIDFIWGSNQDQYMENAMTPPETSKQDQQDDQIQD
jgi:hypothetical protein